MLGMKQMSSFFQRLETAGNDWKRIHTFDQHWSSEGNRIKQNQAKLKGIEGG